MFSQTVLYNSSGGSLAVFNSSVDVIRQARRTCLHKSASRLPLGALVVLRVTSDAFRISQVGHLDEVILSLMGLP